MANYKSLTEFDWDGGNLEKNRTSHSVEWNECEEIFFNSPLIIKDDSAHSTAEIRYRALGRTNDGRKLFLVFTVRINLIRIISARDMSKKERLIYDSKN